MLLFKETKKLFYDNFRYKVVIRTKYCRHFRYEQDLDYILKLLGSDPATDYMIDVVQKLKNVDEFKFRVESPYVSVYLNDEQVLDQILNIDHSAIKYYSKPLIDLKPGEVRVTSLPYGFKIHLKRTHKSHAEFVDWAVAQPSKFKLPSTCQVRLRRSVNHLPVYFYAKDENSILLAKMMLGSSFGHIEKIVKD